MSKVNRITSTKKIMTLLDEGTHVIRSVCKTINNCCYYYREFIPIEERKNKEYIGKRIPTKLFIEELKPKLFLIKEESYCFFSEKGRAIFDKQEVSD